MVTCHGLEILLSSLLISSYISGLISLAKKLQVRKSVDGIGSERLPVTKNGNSIPDLLAISCHFSSFPKAVSGS